MANNRRLALVAAALALASGCMEPQGLLYTHTVRPYDFKAGTCTRVASKACAVDVTQLKEPLTGASITVIWTDRAVLDARAQVGMTELRYVDLETLSVLNATYRRQRLIFHGE